MQWLAWLGLILAAQIAGTVPAAAGDRHDCAGTRAGIRHAPAQDEGIAACDLDSADRDDHMDGPAVAPVVTPRPSSMRSGAPRRTAHRSYSSGSVVRFGPRPPPFSYSR